MMAREGDIPGILTVGSVLGRWHPWDSDSRISMVMAREGDIPGILTVGSVR